jgi:DNA polymerase III delta prime subunit
MVEMFSQECGNPMIVNASETLIPGISPYVCAYFRFSQRRVASTS